MTIIIFETRKVSLGSSDWPRDYDSPVSAFHVLGLQVSNSVPRSLSCILNKARLFGLTFGCETVYLFHLYFCPAFLPFACLNFFTLVFFFTFVFYYKITNIYASTVGLL